MSNIPLPGQTYKHFKGKLYKIVTMAENSETGEKLVIYQALYGNYSVYARPLSMFCERVDSKKYPNATQEYRFELQQQLDLRAEYDNEAQYAKAESASNFGYTGETDVTNQMDESNQEETKELEVTSDEETPNKFETTEECNIDPLVMEFLDTKSYETRINILAALHHRITDDMITTMAMAADLEVPEGDTEQRFEELKQCLLTFEKYEGCRMR